MIHGTRDVSPWCVEQVAALGRRFASGLDLGCGTGHVSEALAPVVRRVIAVDESGAMLTTALSVLQVFIAVILILLILLHSGKDAGMSGAFGVGVAGGSTGGSLMERNLDRWTIFFAIVFVANTIVLLKL